MSHLDKLRQLSREQRRLLFQSVLLLPLIHVALLFLGYYRLLGLIEKVSPSKIIDASVSDAEILQRGQIIARIVSIAGQHGFYKATCLRRSLLVWWFLRREGIASTIRFGVRMSGGRLEAHAWVEYNGTVINDVANIHEHYPTLQEALPPTSLGL